MWFKRANTGTIDLNTSPDETLFAHQNVMEVMFLVNDYTNIRVECLDQSNLAVRANTGYNRWYFLEVSNTFAFNTISLYESDGSIVVSEINSYSS